MYTFQDFEKSIGQGSITNTIAEAIVAHTNSDMYNTAKSADEYDHQRNETITNYVKTIFSMTGAPIEDFTASNNRLCSNFFHRLNTQRNTYLLGNGVSFSKHKEREKNEDGIEITVDTTKQALGDKFDTDLKTAGYDALIHGVSFGFWNNDRLYVFPLTEFVPLWDEDTGILKAGIRFWRIDETKPMIAVLYEEDGYTKFKSKAPIGMDFEETDAKRSYKSIVESSEVGGDEVVGTENYGSLPIVPLWGSKLKQSTLVGMREKIDSFDLIRSGFANDLTDCAQIYWILENCGGMNDQDLDRFRSRLKITHIATADADETKVVPYTQDIPYNARKEYLDEIRSGIYEDFGGLDVHTVEAGATNDHIDAAYQPMDEEADDFEYQVTEFIMQILSIIGIDDVPVFKRNRISNQKEQVEMVAMEANWLDDETILQKLPNITVDEIAKIMANKLSEDTEKFETEESSPNNGNGSSLAQNDEGAPTDEE